MMTIAELLTRWNTDEGKPYKGSLIDLGSYYKDPTDPGCMCAQGQVLHDIGGWGPETLSDADQSDADCAVAAILNISTTHAILLRQVNDGQEGAPAIVLTDPGKVLGSEWSKVLDLWFFLDGIPPSENYISYTDAHDATYTAAYTAAENAAKATAGNVATKAAAKAASWDAAEASLEIQGASIFGKNGTPFSFLPKFGFASPDDIPARPANYGLAASTKEDDT